MPKHMPSPSKSTLEDITEGALSTSKSSMALKQSTREGSISFQYPLLMRSNYAVWVIKMKVYLKAQGVWDAIDSEEEVDDHKDQMALTAIYQVIPKETLLMLAEKETSKEAWMALKTIHMGVERVKETKVQTLKSEFDVLHMKEGESIDDFAAKLMTFVNNIRTLGSEMEEAYVVKKFLRAVSSKFLQIVSTIEKFGDFTTMMVEEVIGHLKAHEERLRGYHDSGSEEHLFFTQAKWKAREKKAEGNGSS